MGAERKSMLLTDEEKRVTAYHEAGHALVSIMQPHSDPIHKVTIIPRGMALGVTIFLPGDATTTPANTSKRISQPHTADEQRKRFSSIRCPPAQEATSRTPPTLLAAWFASTA